MTTPRQYLYRYCTYCRTPFDKPKKQHVCSKCSSAIRKMKKRALLDGYYTKGCADCGETDRRVLEVHHDTPRNGDAAPTGTRGRTVAQLRHELEDCTILCANCHKRRHYVAPPDAPLRMTQHNQTHGMRHYATKATPELLEHVRSERAKGLSYKKIGEPIGIAPQTIMRWLKRDWNAPLPVG